MGAQVPGEETDRAVDFEGRDFLVGAAPDGLARGLPFLDLGDEPPDLRVLRPVAGSRRVDRGDREAAGGDVGEGPAGQAEPDTRA